MYHKFFYASNNLINCVQILLDTKIVKQQLSDIESRHNDIRNLEKTLEEVRDMFMKMAVLVEKQVSINIVKVARL